jgi:hypothetical protein
MGIASPIKEMSGNSSFVIDSTHCNSKAVLCSGNNGVTHIIERVINSRDGQFKTSVDRILCSPYMKNWISSLT